MTTPSPAARVVPSVLRAGPLALLLLLTLWVYRPYVGARLVSGNDDSDAFTYHAVVADALAQSHAGVFPPYVGQSAYRWNGGTYPQAQAPGLSLLAVALDVATLGRLSSVSVLNAAVLLCALGGALGMYLALRRFDGGRAWLSAALALLYVTCPGVLGVLVRLDMYSTFLALPLLPLVWGALLGLLRSGAQRQALALGLSLAALWSCHPPVALWATSVAALGALVFAPVRAWPVRPLLFAIALFAVAEAWHLTTLFSLGAERANTVPMRTMTQAIARNLRADLPGALLPVGWSRGGPVNGWPVPGDEATSLPPSWRVRAGTPYLQLGYALWAALLLGLVAWLRRGERRAAAPVAGALLLLALLFPWPPGELAWAHLPELYGITRIWPMQRFYVLLAALAPFCAVPVLASLRPRLLLAVLLPALLWSLAEAEKFSALGLRSRRDPGARLAENSPLKRKDLQMGARRPWPEHSDPALHLRLVGDDGALLLDNLAALRAQADASGWTTSEPQARDSELARLTLEPGARQVAFFRASSSVKLAASGPGYWRQALADELPLWTSRPQQPLALRVLLPPGSPPLSIEWSLVPYAPERLPLGLVGLVPLQVRLGSAGAAATLETPRLYLPGYRASADAVAAPVRPSAAGYATVALPAGARDVRLEYVGTPAMRAAFWLSALAWLLGLVALARSALDHFGRRRQDAATTAARGQR